MRTDKPLSPFEIRIYHHYRVLHGIRIGLTFVLTFLLTRLLNIPESTWAIVTTVVIMAPISFWGNVVSRAVQRIGGTILGSISGLIALQLELYSLSLMLIWCAVAMFLCSWQSLGKKPYEALLIGITLAIVVGSPTSNMDTALWRSADVILGSLLALIFTGIFPLRAFFYWRIKLAGFLLEYNKLYQEAFLPDLQDRSQVDQKIQELLTEMVKMRNFISPASQETRVPKSTLEAIHKTNRNLFSILEMQINIYWSDLDGHTELLATDSFREAHKKMQDMLLTISNTLYEGKKQNDHDLTKESDQIEPEHHGLLGSNDLSAVTEISAHSYLWLNMEAVRQLKLLSDLINKMLHECK